MNDYRDCNDEVVIKLIGKLTLELPDLEMDLSKQLKVRRVIEETLYNYQVTSKETALVTSDLDGKIQYFLASKKLEGLSSKTLKNYSYILNKLSKFFNKPVRTITTADMKMFMYANSEGKKEASLNTFMTPIKLFFSFLQNEEFILKNPCASLKPVKEPKRMRQPLTEEEVEMIRDTTMTKRERAMFEFMLSTGCRVSEVSDVKINDINMTNKTLTVIGKGNKERRVYFTERCKRALINYLNSRSDTNEYLFVSERAPYEKLNSRGMQRSVNKIKEKANIQRKVSPHIFRHTFATLALNSGMSIEIVQALLGHENPSTTQVYAKLNMETIEHSYRRLVS